MSTTRKSKEEIKITLTNTLPRRVKKINSNPQVYTTQEGIKKINSNPQVYTTQEGIEEFKNYPPGVHYPGGYRRD